MTVEHTPNNLQFVFRISDERGTDMAIENKAVVLASRIETELGVDGSNIYTGVGRWKGSNEFGATIETVVKNYIGSPSIAGDIWLASALRMIRMYAVEHLQCTVFVTIVPVHVVELY